MYGEIFEGVDYTNAKAGVNDCKFVSFGLNPNGGSGGSPKDVIDLMLKVGGLDIKTRWFEQEKGKQNLRKVKDPLTGVERDQTVEEAFKKAVQEQQWITKSILTALGVPTTAFNEGMKSVKDFKSYAAMLTSLVPKGAVEGDYECILQYDQKGYLKMPNKLWITGRVFRDKNSKQEPLEPSKRLTMTKPGEEEEKSDAPATSTWVA